MWIVWEFNVDLVMLLFLRVLVRTPQIRSLMTWPTFCIISKWNFCQVFSFAFIHRFEIYWRIENYRHDCVFGDYFLLVWWLIFSANFCFFLLLFVSIFLTIWVDVAASHGFFFSSANYIALMLINDLLQMFSFTCYLLWACFNCSVQLFDF